MGEVAEFKPQQQAAPAVASLVPANMDQAMRLADMMSHGKLVPQHLQGSPADCLMVIEQAARWKMSPFAVAQATSSIKGKLMFEGKLVAAALHTSGILSRRLNFEFSGEGQSRTVTVTGTIRDEKEPRSITLHLIDAATDNGMWKKQPDQQLCYAGARVWARRHAPEVMLGVYTPDEFDAEPQHEHPAEPQALNERPAYPAEQFEANLETWKGVIQSGRMTADQLIAKVETKGTLSPKQQKTLRDFEVTDAEEVTE